MLGASVVITGQVQRKAPYTPKNGGATEHNITIGVVGGQYRVNLRSKEALDAAPAEGELARLEGALVHNAFGGYDVVAQSVHPVQIPGFNTQPPQADNAASGKRSSSASAA